MRRLKPQRRAAAKEHHERLGVVAVDWPPFGLQLDTIWAPFGLHERALDNNNTCGFFSWGAFSLESPL